MTGLTGYILTGLVSLVVGVLLKYFEARARVVFWAANPVLFNLRNENVVLQTNALNVQNLGRQSAEDVEIVHKTKPDFFQFSPPLAFEEVTTANGEHVIRVKSLGPKEWFTLQIMSYKTIPILLYVRSKAGAATPIQVRFQKYVRPWGLAIIWFLLLVGFGFTAYWLVQAFVFISKSVGLW